MIFANSMRHPNELVTTMHMLNSRSETATRLGNILAIQECHLLRFGNFYVNC